MSLVRLLTAGKSLVGIQDSKSRYRSVDPRAMPKFGSEKKVNTDIARKSGARPSVVKSNAENSKAEVETMPAETARKARGSGWVSQWGSKLSSLVTQKPRPTRSAISRSNCVPVQGELSLDNIKVVRNDLSDADLEVVTKKMAPAKKEGETHKCASMKGASAQKAARLSAMFSAVNS
jgi:hypothetical protein